MGYSAEIHASSIVVNGDFNPAIFTPDWLEKNSLIGASDAEYARDKSEGREMTVSHTVTLYDTEWFELQVTDTQFIVASKGALSMAFKDLVVGIFQLVPHTPVRAAGLNFLSHFKFDTEGEYHHIGDVVAPKYIWNALYPKDRAGIADLTILIEPGLRGEVIKTKDNKRITIQPSARVKNAIFMSYNDHHDLTLHEDETQSPTEKLIALIDNQWEDSWKDSLRVFNVTLSMALETRI